MTKLYAMVKRGHHGGIEVKPHEYANGKYRLAWNYAKRKQYVEVDLAGIEPQLRNGMKLWMSNRKEKHPPGLVRPQSIHGWN